MRRIRQTHHDRCRPGQPARVPDRALRGRGDPPARAAGAPPAQLGRLRPLPQGARRRRPVLGRPHRPPALRGARPVGVPGLVGRALQGAAGRQPPRHGRGDGGGLPDRGLPPRRPAVLVFLLEIILYYLFYLIEKLFWIRNIIKMH